MVAGRRRNHGRKAALVLAVVSLSLFIRTGDARALDGPTVSVDFDAAQYSVREGGTVPVTVRLSARPGRQVTLEISVQCVGEATSADYSLSALDVTFASHETERTFAVTASPDTEREDVESIVIGFASPLPAGVHVGRPATAQVTFVDDPPVVTSDYNVLNALRARFTGGVVIFNRSPRMPLTTPDDDGVSQFGQASPYLALEVQPRIGPVQNLEEPKDRHFYLEPFVNVRLTAIPVVGASSNAGQKIGVPAASFLQSQKSAQVQLGTVLNFASFGGSSAIGGDDKQHHWGLGIVTRGMFQSVTSTQRTLRVWNIDDDLYDARTAGFRLTLHERRRTARSWMPVAYIDASVGWFQNFEVVKPVSDDARDCLAEPSACLEKGDLRPAEEEFRPDQKARLYVEGRMFVDPFYIGFDLNNGEGLDDLRFSAGVTFDLKRFFEDRD